MTIAWVVFALALLPAALFVANLFFFRRPQAISAEPVAVSVLIPARNEERFIAACIASALQSDGVDVEVLVLDDHSTDDTPAIVSAIAARDSRVKLLQAGPLPADWCGKQHSCYALAQQARHRILCFVDADVALAPSALAKSAEYLRRSGCDLVSAFPRQRTGTFLEHLLIPMIHFVLLGYLPMAAMRMRSTDPAFAAGCGQFMMTTAGAYRQSGGHAAVRATMHDGLKLPKAYRSAGLRTDVFDASEMASCRMYRGAAEVWNGLAKNAVEGMAAPGRIGVFTVLLLGGQVAPFLLAVAAPVSGVLWAAIVCAYLPRWIAAVRYRQSYLGALLHPAGVALLLTLQWYALARHLSGRPAQWKGRSYTPSKASDVGQSVVQIQSRGL